MNRKLNAIKKNITESKLGEALKGLEEIIDSHMEWGISDELKSLNDNYELMTSSLANGMKDPSLEENYSHLLHQTYALYARVKWHIRKTQNQAVTFIYGQKPDFDVEYCQTQLENFYADEVLGQPDYKQHQLYINKVFTTLTNQELWSNDTAEKMEMLLLSPTIDTKDKLLMITAIMLSAAGTFDLRKLTVLLHVYLQTDDENVRIRALVGWVMSIDYDMVDVYPEQKEMLFDLTDTQPVIEDLYAMQAQMVYCLNAMEDHKAIKEDILSDLVKDQGTPNIDIRIIEDPEEIEDFLEREEAEDKLDALQDKVEQMMDMQRSGADIYFGGFASMKNYAFFNTLANWFCPFYIEHPEITNVFNDEENVNAIKNLLNAVPFCDSDKYSFALTMHMVIPKIPKDMLKLLDTGELKSMENFANIPESTLILRRYLQDLYRFFRLCPMNKKFVNIFEPEKCLFITNSMFLTSHFIEKSTSIAKILIKKDNDRYFQYLAQHCLSMTQELLGMIGKRYMQKEDYETALHLFQELFEENNESKIAVRGLAKCYFHLWEHEKALEMYNLLEQMSPDNDVVKLNKYVCMTYLSLNLEDAIAGLAKLCYEHPDKTSYLSALGWAYLVHGKLDMALKKYNEAIALPDATEVDHFHIGLAYACADDIQNAVVHMAQYFQKEDSYDYIVDVIKEEAVIVSIIYNIKAMKLALIADLIKREQS